MCNGFLMHYAIRIFDRGARLRLFPLWCAGPASLPSPCGGSGEGRLIMGACSRCENYLAGRLLPEWLGVFCCSFIKCESEYLAERRLPELLRGCNRIFDTGGGFHSGWRVALSKCEIECLTETATMVVLDFVDFPNATSKV